MYTLTIKYYAAIRNYSETFVIGKGPLSSQTIPDFLKATIWELLCILRSLKMMANLESKHPFILH